MAHLLAKIRENAYTSGVEFIIGGLSATCAGVFTNPLELIKIRMQLQGEAKNPGQYTVVYKNIFHAAYVISKTEGIMALQAGLPASLWFMYIYNSVRLGTYQIFMKNGLMQDEEGRILFYRSLFFGGISGMLGAISSNPLGVVKTYAQSKAPKEFASGFQHEYFGVWGSLVHQYKKRGIRRGLYKGCVASLPKAFLGSTAQLTTFEYTKDVLIEQKIFQDSYLKQSLVASMLGGLVVATVMAPFDVAMTRIYNQGVDEFGKGLLYDGLFDCMKKIYQLEGYSAFYKGLGASYLRLGPQTVLSIMFWDYFTKRYHELISIQ